MKRPVPVYFIVAWCFLVISYLCGHLTRFFESPSLRSAIPEGLRLSCLGGSIWLYAVALWFGVVGLLQLRSFSLNFSVAVLALNIARLAWSAWYFFPRVPHPVRLLIGTLILVGLNAACIWYLARPDFRKYAAEFVAERAARKASSRNTQGGGTPS